MPEIIPAEITWFCKNLSHFFIEQWSVNTGTIYFFPMREMPEITTGTIAIFKVTPKSK